MPAYETTLLSREQVAEGTMAFRFAMPDGFKFRAGRSIMVTLVDPTLVEAIQTMLAGAGVRTEDIRGDEFFGY